MIFFSIPKPENYETQWFFVNALWALCDCIISQNAQKGKELHRGGS
jgi:hypothetical protein